MPRDTCASPSLCSVVNEKRGCLDRAASPASPQVQHPQPAGRAASALGRQGAGSRCLAGDRLRHRSSRQRRKTPGTPLGKEYFPQRMCQVQKGPTLAQPCSTGNEHGPCSLIGKHKGRGVP